MKWLGMLLCIMMVACGSKQSQEIAENVESITHKCQYIFDQNLHGAMYWEYNSEKDDHPMARTIRNLLLPE